MNEVYWEYGAPKVKVGGNKVRQRYEDDVRQRGKDYDIGLLMNL